MSLKPEDCNSNITDLDESKIKVLDDWQKVRSVTSRQPLASSMPYFSFPALSTNTSALDVLMGLHVLHAAKLDS